MARNRDLSVLLVATFARMRGREIDVADVLAGAGARTLRLANEVPEPIVLHANDADRKAIDAIRDGIEQNRLSGPIDLHNKVAHDFLGGQRFDVVDLDPFGSPAPFVDACVGATRHDGLVCLTATDTGALAGTYPRVCKRRYQAMPLHRAPWRQEVGLRILARTVIDAAGRQDRVAEPVLSVCQNHWMRVVCRIRDGRKLADTARRDVGYVQWDPKTSLPIRHDDPRTIPPGAAYGGPLWWGPLHDAEVVAQMAALAEGMELADAGTLPLLRLLRDEAALPAFWLDRGRLQARFGDAPRRDRLIAALQESGFRAGRTHMDPQGIRTDANLESLQNVWHLRAK